MYLKKLIVMTDEHKSLEALMSEREEKANLLREKGINPYPHKFAPTHSASQINSVYANIAQNEPLADVAKIAGRVARVANF